MGRSHRRRTHQQFRIRGQRDPRDATATECDLHRLERGIILARDGVPELREIERERTDAHAGEADAVNAADLASEK
jgi:hypothetical protein